jgi:hypothetical protein
VLATTVPMTAFIATVKLNVDPALSCSDCVAVASTVPVALAPAYIVNVNVSLPDDALIFSVQVRMLLLVVHKLELALTSKICGEPLFTTTETELALGETNCG